MYNKPRIIPSLLLDDGDLVKTVQFNNPTYLGDPVNAVKIFNIKRIDEMAILDISVTKKGLEPDYALLEDIASQAFMPLSYGGGIKNVDQIRQILKMGYEKVVINTSLIDNPDLITEAACLFGSQSIVASIDAKKVLDNKNKSVLSSQREINKFNCYSQESGYNIVVADGTRIISDISPATLAQKAVKLGAGEILLNSIDRDGTFLGYDLDLVRSVSDAVAVPVIACGGARTTSDLRNVIFEGHAHAAAAGSMFVFYGKLRAVLITMPNDKELGFDAL